MRPGLPRRHCRGRLALLLATAAIVMVSVNGVTPVMAQDVSVTENACIAESEPNDAPNQATTAAGAVCLAGTLPQGDQDLFVWEVTAAASQSAWTIVAEGVPGARTIAELQLVTSPPGSQPIELGGLLLSLPVEPDATAPTVLEEVLLAPGRYLVGISAGGQPVATDASPLSVGDGSLESDERSPSPENETAAADAGPGYRLRFEPGAALPPVLEAEPNDDPGAATPVSGVFHVAGDLDGSPDAYRWTVESESAGAWVLRATRQIGSSGRLTLATGDGAILVRGQTVDGRIELPDLVLSPGDYLVTIDPPGFGPTPYVLSAEAYEVPIGDPEPNDMQERAVPLTGETPLVRGRLARSQDDDWFRFGIDETLASGTVDIRMLWRSGLRRELCLYGSTAEALLCRDSTAGLNVSGLSLLAGPYSLRVRGEPAPEDVYLIRVDPAGFVGVDFEREPNDTPGSATPLDPVVTTRARALGPDVDHFRLIIDGEPQLWQLDARGSGIESMDWIRPDGQRLATATMADDGSSASLLDLYLVPGEHWLRVEAEDGEYTIESTPLGPPLPNSEREPNDLPAREERLLVGHERVGRLPAANDTDDYRFTVRGTDHLLLEVDPPPDGVIDVLLLPDVGASRRLQTAADEPLQDDLLLTPGDYRVVLSPISSSLERYAIRLERLDPYRLAVDQEPNDDPRQARPVPASGVVNGSASGGTSDTDWYVLPSSADGAPVRIVAEGDITVLALDDGTYEQTLYVGADGMTYESSPVSSGVPLLLRVSATGPYTLSLDGSTPGASGSESVATQAAAIEADLTLADSVVAAWWPTGQRLTGVVQLTNTGSADLDTTLDALASDRAWQVGVPAGSVRVPAGGTTDVPLEIRIPRDVPGGEPVRISVRASGPDGAGTTGAIDIEPSREVLPVEQVRAWPVPDALLGGLDVASLALGATPIPSLDADGETRLHDGFVATDWGLSYPIGSLPVTLTVDLAGDEPVPVAGTIIQPFSEDPTLGDAARDFELALSRDGGTWETVLQGTLDPVSVEQTYVLSQPVDARYAQLRITSGQRELPSRLNLGEWKVVATPGWSPPAGPLDLADPRAGGHVVRMTPQPGSWELMSSLLDDDPAPQTLDVEKGAGIEWVLGFMDDRAALVSSLEWRDPLPSDAAARLGRVDVSVSTDSPLGPWRSLGTWKLERAADGSVAPFVSEEPTWSRFLRFSGSAGRKQTQVELPDRIRVIEAAQDAVYRSSIGQWGMGQRDGPLEWITAPAELGQDDEGENADDQGHPRDLSEDESASGRVHFGEDTDWYRVAVPDGQHSLALTVDGPLSVGAALTLQTEDGIGVPMTFGPGEAPGSVTYLAGVEPSTSYLVEVSQPQSSIVVAFDSSASVATQVSAIESGLRALAEGMSGDREAMRIVPFDNEPLLPDWSSDPYEIADAVNRFRLAESSSGVESNLREAALDLASREGGRAVLLITDAASSSFDHTARLWGALATSRPQVFTVAVGGEGEAPAIERHHLMADWAASAGGVSSQARGGEEILQAFDRLATWLRRPVAYTLDYKTFPDELPPPPPGRIGVVAPEVGGQRPAVLGGDVAVELVVDTSGSMLKRLSGGRRIDIAKRVLTALVRDDLPSGTPVALRTFRPQRSCDTLLVTPLGPLDPASLATTIEGLEVPRKAQTPLARAIAAVADDLAGATGPKVVVIVSDGKESCKGDPAAEVKRLRAQGIDVTLNVVGLALDRASRRGIARLAELGGGSYFDATDAETLGAGLRAAVSARYEVRDAARTVVGRSTVGGEPVDVPPGSYEVAVMTDPAVTFEAVYVIPEADIVLTLPSDGG